MLRPPPRMGMVRPMGLGMEPEMADDLNVQLVLLAQFRTNNDNENNNNNPDESGLQRVFQANILELTEQMRRARLASREFALQTGFFRR